MCWTLQELRGAGLISLKGSTLKVLDWDGLKKAGDFDPTYLHLEQEQAAKPEMPPEPSCSRWALRP
jgi:hypothetical protein